MSKVLETKIELEENYMPTEELVKIFSKSKTYLKTVKALEENGFALVKEDDHLVKSNTDLSTSFHIETGKTFEFKTWWASLDFKHKDGHEISMEIGLHSKFKLHKDGYTDLDLIFAEKLIEKSFDINSDTLKVEFNRGDVFLADESSYSKDYITGKNGYSDVIEGGFNTVVRCLTDKDYAHKHIGFAYELNRI